MNEILFVGLVIVALIWVLASGSRFRPPKTQKSSAAIHQSYAVVPSLFVNKSERVFYDILVRELPQPFTVHAKVRLEDIVRVKPDITDAKTRWSLRGRVKSRHVDFLIIDAAGRPCTAIELDGRTHKRKTAENADRLKDGIFEACGLKFARVETGENFQTRIGQIIQSLK